MSLIVVGSLGYHLLYDLTTVTHPVWVSFSSSVEGKGWNRRSWKILLRSKSCITDRIRKIGPHSLGQIAGPLKDSVFFCVNRDTFLPPRCYANPLTVPREILRHSKCSTNSFILFSGTNSCWVWLNIHVWRQVPTAPKAQNESKTQLYHYRNTWSPFGGTRWIHRPTHASV